MPDEERDYYYLEELPGLYVYTVWEGRDKPRPCGVCVRVCDDGVMMEVETLGWPYSRSYTRIATAEFAPTLPPGYAPRRRR